MVNFQQKKDFNTKWYQTQKNSKNVFPNQDLMENVFFVQEIVNFSKTEVLTQNGVRPIKPLLSTQTNEKHNLGQKRSFST